MIPLPPIDFSGQLTADEKNVLDGGTITVEQKGGGATIYNLGPSTFSTSSILVISALIFLCLLIYKKRAV